MYTPVLQAHINITRLPHQFFFKFSGSGDFPSDGTFSSTSSDSENETKAPIAPLPVKYLPLRKRGVSSRTRLKRETFYYDSSPITKPGTPFFKFFSTTATIFTSNYIFKSIRYWMDSNSSWNSRINKSGT